jgi:NhaP-type Na+/H+ or K+/H+ antiporter
MGFLLGPHVLKILDFKISAGSYEILTDYALALVLFNGASRTNLEVLKKIIAIPSRLLLIGLPLTILFGIFAGSFVFSDWLWIEWAILATILAPTDAALGEAVVTNKAVPAKIREALNIESGLNDGISVPVYLLLLTLFKANSMNDVTLTFSIGLFVKEIGFGLLTGIVIMYLGSKLLVFCESRKWIDEGWKPIITIALAFACFSIAQSLGGSGFIACFTGGFLYGIVSKKYKSNLHRHGAGIGNALTFVTWMIFGSFVVSTVLTALTWQVILYAVLSLTLVRIIPVFISLIKTGVPFREKLFIGWFGPRGLASIVFAIILLDGNLPHQEMIIQIIICTILLSVIAHGITANPMASSFKTKLKPIEGGVKK